MDVDNFAQQILEKAEKRSRALGITSSGQVSLQKNSVEDCESQAKTLKTNVPERFDKENRNHFNNEATTNSIYKYSNSKTDNENIDLGIEITVKTDKPYEVRVEVEEHDEEGRFKKVESIEKNAEVRMRDSSRNRLKLLGALYSESDKLSSPIHRTEEKFYAENKDSTECGLGSSKTKNRFGRLAELADSINKWEDESSSGNTINENSLNESNVVAVPKLDSSVKIGSLFNKSKLKNISDTTASIESSSKHLNWDPNVIDSLEAQGFQRRESTTIKYSYEYKRDVDENDAQNRTNSIINDLQPLPSAKQIPSRSGLVMNRTALFEKKDLKIKSLESEKLNKDPTELPLKERRKLFELNKGKPLLPKAPLAIAPSISKIIHSLKNDEHKKESKTVLEEKIENSIGKVDAIKNGRFAELEKELALSRANEEGKDNEAISSAFPSLPVPTWQTEFSPNSTKRRSLAAIGDENKKTRKETNLLYPVINDISSNDDVVNSDNFCCTTTVSAKSFSEDIPFEIEESTTMLNHPRDFEENKLKIDCRGTEYQRGNECNEWKVGDNPNCIENSDSSFSSMVSVGVDDLLDEALLETEELATETADNVSSNSIGTVTSNSFSFRKPTHFETENTGCETIDKEDGTAFFPQPVKSQLEINEESNNMVTLVHTVSFYRKQQSASVNTTPTRKLNYDRSSKTLEYMDPAKNSLVANGANFNEDEEGSSFIDENSQVEEKIKRLLEEVCKQQQIIAQTSQALNLCAATVEFSGSTESVEGERHLLVATHRRQSCLDEVQRLRVEKSIRPLAAPKEKGRLTVKEITIPLRQDYIRKLSADTISGHHLVCLLKYNEHVLSTKTVPTLPGLLAVKFPDVLQLDHVYADFRVTMEIFGMTAQREVLPHEVKYHINLNKKSGIKTPKKKNSENRLVMPPVQSPAGPQTVRTPALVQYGFAIFSLREIQRTSWTLTKVLGVSPLDGIVHMKVNCELSVSVEHRGFLTMFEDISGFGAWHRRWCFLNGTMLNYWKYPDDEKRKTPMGSIDLYSCISQKVSVVPRDICARLNTILLECERPFKQSDHESLVLIPDGRITIVRYLLSADTREEREEWCAHFNKALTLLRAWGPPQ